MSRARALAAALLAGLAGCAGLPARQAPVALAAMVPLDAGGAGGAWPAEQWWRRYQDPTLTALIEQGLAASPTLATAHARFDSARASVRLAGSAAGAHVSLNGAVERQRLSDNGLFPPQFLGFHWYNQTDLGVQAGYTFDWWGKQRAAVAAAVDEAHAVQAERSAAALLLASSIADTYFGWQADQSRLEIARERLRDAEREAAIAALRVRAEVDAAETLHRAAAAVAAVREQMAGLDGSARLRLVALAALVGRPPGELPPLAARPLPQLAADLPDDVRLDLIARRADITASRWRVEAAEENVHAARADFFPDISINALAGLSAIHVDKLIEYGSRVPQAGLAVHLPIFDAGSLKARYGASQALLRAAVAGYQQTLIDAARDVASEAEARRQAAAQRAERQIAVDEAVQLRASAAARVRQGLADSRTELAAADSWLEQRDALVQLDAAAVSADVALQRALGGGYVAPRNFSSTDSTASNATP